MLGDFLGSMLTSWLWTGSVKKTWQKLISPDMTRVALTRWWRFSVIQVLVVLSAVSSETGLVSVSCGRFDSHPGQEASSAFLTDWRSSLHASTLRALTLTPKNHNKNVRALQDALSILLNRLFHICFITGLQKSPRWPQQSALQQVCLSEVLQQHITPEQPRVKLKM